MDETEIPAKEELPPRIDTSISPPLIAAVATRSETSPALPLPWGFWKTIGWSVLILVAAMGSQAFAGALLAIWSIAIHQPVPTSEQIRGNGLILALACLISMPWFVLLSMWFASLRKSLPLKDYFAFRWPARRVVGRWCLGFLALLIVIDILANLVHRPMPDFMLKAYRSAGFLPLLWFAVAIAAPISEEFFFRGFVFTGLRYSRVGGLGAVLGTALFWASIHVQYHIFEMGIIFTVGIFLGIVRLKTNSLWLCILLHSLMNFISLGQLALILSSGILER